MEDYPLGYSDENEEVDLLIHILFAIFVTFNSEEYAKRDHGIRYLTHKTSQPAISEFTIQISRRFSCMDGSYPGTTA